MELKNGRRLIGRLSTCLVLFGVPLAASIPALADYSPGQPLQFHDYSHSSTSHSSSPSSYQSPAQNQSASPSQESGEAPADRARLQQTLQSFFPSQSQSQSQSSSSDSSSGQGQSNQPAGQPVSPPPSQSVNHSSNQTLFPQSSETSTPSSASPPQAPTNALTDSEPSTPKKKSKKNGLLNHLVTGVGSVVEATIAPVPGGAPAVSPLGHSYGPGHGYGPGGGLEPIRPPHLIPQEPSHSGAGLTASGLGMPGSLPVPPGGFGNEHDGNVAGDLAYAYQAEQQGNYHDAASRYHVALIAGTGTITDEDMKNATKNHTSGYAEMKKRMANKNSTYQGWPILELCKHYLWCEVADARQKHSTADGADSIPALIELQLADIENPVWWYLIGAAYASEHHAAEQHNYMVAWYQLNCGLQCKNMTPEIKNKITTLMHHIAPAALLQLQDYDRVRYEHCFDVVNAVDHPTVVNYWSHGVIVYKWDSRASIDAMSYWLAKEFIKNKYPQFIKKYNAYVHWCRNEYPNKAIAVPPSPESDETHVFFYRSWEEKAFGPLDFGTSVL
jgi:hypothetical protein